MNVGIEIILYISWKTYIKHHKKICLHSYVKKPILRDFEFLFLKYYFDI